MKVLFLPEVVNQFLELAQVLYDEGYLGFKDAAIAKCFGALPCAFRPVFAHGRFGQLRPNV